MPQIDILTFNSQVLGLIIVFFFLLIFFARFNLWSIKQKIESRSQNLQNLSQMVKFSSNYTRYLVTTQSAVFILLFLILQLKVLNLYYRLSFWNKVIFAAQKKFFQNQLLNILNGMWWQKAALKSLTYAII